MSTLKLDASGARALTTTTNDPSNTQASMSAKAGDDVLVTLGGVSEIRIGLLESARIQRRQYVRTTTRTVDGRAVPKEGGGYEQDETLVEELVLVLAGSATVFGRTSHLPSENAPEPPSYESTPHTTVYAKRWGADPHHLESGELLEEVTLAELLVGHLPGEE